MSYGTHLLVYLKDKGVIQRDKVKTMILHCRENVNSHDEPDKLGGLTICHHVIRLISVKKKQQKFGQKLSFKPKELVRCAFC